jgi:hypothetical protein
MDDQLIANAQQMEQSRADGPPPVETPKTEQPTENRSKIDALNKSGKLMSSDPAEKSAALRELNKLLADETTEEERAAILEEPVESLRERYGVKSDAVLAPLRDRWDAEGERTVLASFAYHGVDPAAGRAIMDWYVARFNGALGDPANLNAREMTAELEALARKHDLDERLVRDMIEWQSKRVQS